MKRNRAVKITATPEQRAALAKIVHSFDRDVIVSAMAGRGDRAIGLWWIYLASLRAEVSSGKVYQQALKVRRNLLVTLASFIGHAVTIEDVRAVLIVQDALDECAVDVIAADFEKLKTLQTRRQRRPAERNIDQVLRTLEKQRAAVKVGRPMLQDEPS